MRTSIRHTLVVATLGLFTIAGCDSNPGGPTFPDVPKSQEEPETTSKVTGKKGKKKSMSSVMINDPAK